VEEMQALVDEEFEMWKQKKKKSATRRAGEEDPIWTREKFPECQDQPPASIPTAAEGIFNHSDLNSSSFDYRNCFCYS
jgi:hypothetical protein